MLNLFVEWVGVPNIPLLPFLFCTVSTPGPSMKRYRGRFHDKSLNRYGIPFPGSDASVVRRSQRNLVEQDKDAYQPFQYGAYLTVESRLWFNVLSFYGLIFQLLARFRVGRWLLLRVRP